MSTPDTPKQPAATEGSPQWQKDASEAAANAIGRITVAAPDQDFPSYEAYWNELRSRILLFIAHYAPQPTAPTAQPDDNDALYQRVDETKKQLDAQIQRDVGKPAATGTPEDVEEAAYQKWYREALPLGMLSEVEAWCAGVAFARGQAERELAEARAERDQFKKDQENTQYLWGSAIEQRDALRAALAKQDEALTALRGLLGDAVEAIVECFGEPTPEKLAYHSTARDDCANRSIAKAWENVIAIRARLATPTAGGKEGRS